MVAPEKKKGRFGWQVGETLDEDNFAPLGDIRAHGLPKVNKAVARDPAVRKQERERLLAGPQSRPYKEKMPPERHDVIVEENSGSSDISGDFEDSEVKRLTGKGDRLRGFDLFGRGKKK